MYYGKKTTEIENLESEYKNIIGVSIDGEMGFEIDEEDSDLYAMMLKECINTKKDIFTLIKELDEQIEAS